MSLDNPQRWECGNCGYAFYDQDEWDQWFCSQCGEEMHTAPPEGYTPNDELRELIEEWRNPDATGIDYYAPIGLEQAADELETLIDD